METIVYQISRGGQVTGVVTGATLSKMVEEGAVLETDAYWTEGMPEWRPMAELMPELRRLAAAIKSREKEAARRAKAAEKAERERQAELTRKAEEQKRQAEEEERQRRYRELDQAARRKQPDYGPWKCLSCGGRSEFCRMLAEGSGVVWEGLMLIAAGFVVTAIGTGIMLSGELRGGALFIVMLLAGLLSVFCYAYGIAKIIGGGSLLAIEEDKGRRRCPNCQGSSLIKEANSPTN